MRILPKNIGVLAFLGPFKKHGGILKKMNINFTYVKTVEELNEVDALIIPGSEISALYLGAYDLLPFIAFRVKEGMNLFLTGEAAVLLSKEEKSELSFRRIHIKKYHKQATRQYTENLRLSFSDTRFFPGFFLRSPVIEKIDKKFRVLATKESDGTNIVCMENHNILISTFYPEFTDDIRLHEYFLTKI